MGDPTGEDRSEPTLELPSLFRRRRRAAATAEPEPEPQPPAPQPEPEPEPVESTQVIPHPEPPTALAPAAQEPVWEPEPEPEPVSPGGQRRAERQAPRRARRARRTPRETPALPAAVAAVLTGLVVGLGGALLTYGALQGCELLRGTDSCGGPGLLLLVAILVVMVLAGATMLAWLGVSEPRGTSFLGVGITAVVAMVALLETLFSAWMFVAVPVLAAAAYLLAEWVTTRFVEELDAGPVVDVR